jgi:uncharacterized repeat protein (TIGR03803 family)
MVRVSVFATIMIPMILVKPAHAATFTTLYQFTDKTDGGEPLGGVVEDALGTLYGETYQGGSSTCPNPPYNRQGCGTVYSFSKAQGFRLLASFNGTNGAHGNITPVLAGATLYGATARGGAKNDGVIFSVNTDGTGYKLLYQFSGPDGSDPLALAMAPSGVLYGITEVGGASNVGVLFSLTQAGVYTILHNFALPVSADPNTLIVAANGTLVGSSLGGGSRSATICDSRCGTVFSYVPETGIFTTLYTLSSSGVDGGYPYVGSLGPGPTIYGLETASVFGLSQHQGFAPLADLNPYTVGSGPVSGPVYAPSGTLYGVLGGSITATYGLIYSLQNGIITDLYLFSGLAKIGDGADPIAKPFLTSSGSLIGTTTEYGRCIDCGTVWEYTP